MRKIFAQMLVEHCNSPDTLFLTGDLGFMAFEGIRDAFGSRFINCGIAEQNMVSVAAGLAREGFKVLVYSIAPFIYARPFEQIRNDICFSHLSVCLVGNGGGYGYGHMGPTHHALEDCAAMQALGLNVLVPAFEEDIPQILTSWNGPTYLRLGLDASPEDFMPSTFTPWRNALAGERGVWVILGPLAGIALGVLLEVPRERRPALWICSAFETPPPHFYEAIRDQFITVFEEHVAEGGLAMMLARDLLLHQVRITGFMHRCAIRYPSQRFGSQAFHRAECKIDADAMRQLLGEIDE